MVCLLVVGNKKKMREMAQGTFYPRARHALLEEFSWLLGEIEG
jgi:hypothetical protein